MLPPLPHALRESVSVDPELLARHGSSSGPIRIAPAAVATPRSVEDVQGLVVWAEAEGVPLIPRGAGTGMPGGNVGSGVVLDLSRLVERGELVDEEGGPRLRVSAGVVAAEVERVARAAGHFLPPLPSSAERCTLGGMIANNAAGARSFRYGAMRAWVEELEVVAAGGETFVLRGRPSAWSEPLRAGLAEGFRREPLPWPDVRKNSSGYALDRFLPTGDALQLFVGSEGTLGVIMGARVRVERQPERTALLVCGLPDREALVEAARFALAVDASACEFLGRRLVELAGLRKEARLAPLVDGAEGLLLLELSGPHDAVDERLQEARRFARSLGTGLVEATDENDARALWELRHRASPSIARAADEGRLSTQFIEDSVVPVGHLPDYLDGLDAILAEAGTEAVVFGHLGDGNLHVNPLLDVRRPGWRSTADRILGRTAQLVASLGGTLSGEHGDGRVRAPWLATIWPHPVVAAFRTVKRTLDPAGVFNPGVILPLPDQTPLQGLWDHLPHAGEERPGGAELARKALGD